MITADKRNAGSIRYRLEQVVFKSMLGQHEQGGPLSMFDRPMLAGIGRKIVTAIMREERLGIVLHKLRS